MFLCSTERNRARASAHERERERERERNRQRERKRKSACKIESFEQGNQGALYTQHKLALKLNRGLGSKERHSPWEKFIRLNDKFVHLLAVDIFRGVDYEDVTYVSYSE